MRVLIFFLKEDRPLTTRIVLKRFNDMHAHLREGPMIMEVTQYTAQYCGRAVAMPNKKKPIRTGKHAMLYKEEIEEASGSYDFEPLMTIAIGDDTTPKMIKEAKEAGVVGGKFYPRGVTTNSEHGLTSFNTSKIREVIRAMEKHGMLCLLHGEMDKDRVLVTEREKRFLPTLKTLSIDFPDLKIVLEHVSSKAGVNTVKLLGKNVAATITAHHLYLTLNDVIGSGIRPHNGCMPMPKSFEDLDALKEAAMSGNPKFFLGSDSAPHLREKKESAVGACGVFSAPVLPSVLAEVFEEHGKLEYLEDFTSRYGAEFYGLPRNKGTITMVKKPWIVPEEYHGIVPFKAGEKLQWQMV